MKRLILTILAATALVLPAASASAESRCPTCGRIHAAAPRPSPTPVRTYPNDRQRPYDPSWFTPDLYPQWYGGFHGRILQNYGYPAGDIGVRGTAW